MYITKNAYYCTGAQFNFNLHHRIKMHQIVSTLLLLTGFSVYKIDSVHTENLRCGGCLKNTIIYASEQSSNKKQIFNINDCVIWSQGDTVFANVQRKKIIKMIHP